MTENVAFDASEMAIITAMHIDFNREIVSLPITYRARVQHVSLSKMRISQRPAQRVEARKWRPGI